MKKKIINKCIINGCENTKDQGNFVGDLCCPCYEYIKEGKGKHSQAYRNFKQLLYLTIKLKDEEISKTKLFDENKYFLDDDGSLKKKWSWFSQGGTIEYTDYLARRGKFLSCL